MSKVVTSPIEAFPGKVTLADPLTFPQSIVFEEAIEATQGETVRAKVYYALLPGILACVEEWNLEGIPSAVGADNFPSTPRQAAAELIDWLVEQILLVFSGGESVPSEQ